MRQKEKGSYSKCEESLFLCFVVAIFFLLYFTLSPHFKLAQSKGMCTASYINAFPPNTVLENLIGLLFPHSFWSPLQQEDAEGEILTLDIASKEKVKLCLTFGPTLKPLLPAVHAYLQLWVSQTCRKTHLQHLRRRETVLGQRLSLAWNASPSSSSTCAVGTVSSKAWVYSYWMALGKMSYPKLLYTWLW